MCSFLQAMASSCSPPHAASHPVTTSDVTVIVSDVLRRLVASGHLRPLVTALIDGIGDEFGSRGTGLVLAALLESRGSEESLKSHTGQLIWLKRRIHHQEVMGSNPAVSSFSPLSKGTPRPPPRSHGLVVKSCHLRYLNLLSLRHLS